MSTAFPVSSAYSYHRKIELSKPNARTQNFHLTAPAPAAAKFQPQPQSQSQSLLNSSINRNSNNSSINSSSISPPSSADFSRRSLADRQFSRTAGRPIRSLAALGASSLASPARPPISMPGSALKSNFPSVDRFAPEGRNFSAAAKIFDSLESPSNQRTANKQEISITPNSSSSRSPEFLLEFGSAENPNLGWRESMEDEILSSIGFEGGGFFAIFDGHGGRAVVEFLKKSLIDKISSHLRSRARPLDAIQLSLTDLDNEMSKSKKYFDCGSTVAAVMIKNNQNNSSRELFASNVGDSRIIMAEFDPSSGSLKANRLSRDHRPNSPSEIERIRKCAGSGSIIRGRVGGVLSLSRALGDHSLKSFGISSLAHQRQLVLDPAIHKFLILACDGFTDVVEDSEAVALVAGMENSSRMAEILCKTAIDRGSTDNVSVCVIRLHK